MPVSPYPWSLGAGWVEGPTGTFTWTWDGDPLHEGDLISNDSPNFLITGHQYNATFRVQQPGFLADYFMMFSLGGITVDGFDTLAFSFTVVDPETVDNNWTVAVHNSGIQGLLIEPRTPGLGATLIVSNVHITDLVAPAITGMSCAECP